MQIKQAKIVGFGQWTNQTFDFDAGLQLIFGMNEAGKTTLHQFINGVLFGFPQAKGRHVNTYEPQNQGAYGGSLIFEVEQKLYELTRMGRTQSTLKLVAIEEEIEFGDPQAQLQTLLGPLTKESFEAVFSFNQEALLAIFALKPAQLNEHLRQIVVPGSPAWLDFSEQLDKQATDQFGTTKTAKRALNNELKTLSEAKQSLQNAVENEPQLVELDQQIATTKAQIQALLAAQADQQHTALQTAKQAQLAPVIERRDTIKAQLAQRSASLELGTTNQLDALISQIKVLNQAGQADLIDGSQLDQAEHQLSELVASVQQQTDLQRQEIALKQQQAVLLQKYNLVEPPHPINDVAAAALQKASPTRRGKPDYTTNKRNLLLVGILIAFTAMFIAVMMAQFIVGGVMAALLVFSIVLLWHTQQKPAATPPINPIIVPGYEKFSPQEILLMQPDMRQLDQTTINHQVLTQRIAALTPQIIQLRSALSWLDMQEDESYLRQQLANLRAKMAQTTQVQQQLQSLTDDLNQTLLRNGLTSISAYEARKQADEETRRLQNELTMLEAQVTEFVEPVKNPAMPVTVTTQTLPEAQQHLADLTQQRQRLISDVKISTTQQSLANQTAKLEAELTDYFVNRLTATWINATLNTAIGSRAPLMLAQAGEILAKLTQGKYTKLAYNKTMLEVSNFAGDTWQVIQLSKGTAEQVYVALRLAFAQVVRTQMPMPLLIDDAFVDFDTQRRTAMLYVLNELATAGTQILYFTAHHMPNEQNILDLDALKEEL
ncbi:MAG: AAA family ATPase [Lactobacillaceae bacterium]|jgi:uncharacterized protein YhaN|nr:AAA family ATPase [Lactobacillaceae bacterium]